MSFKKTLATILAVSSIFLSGCKKDSVKYDYENYGGKIKNYSVRIDERSIENKPYSKLVHLEAPDSNMVPYGVTGHDYNSDGNWERIFIRETFSHGCNAMNFTGSEPKWEPCPADKDKVKPFTSEQIEKARNLLDKAVEDVYYEEHKVK